jgi:hypothetical protein
MYNHNGLKTNTNSMVNADATAHSTNGNTESQGSICGTIKISILGSHVTGGMLKQLNGS